MSAPTFQVGVLTRRAAFSNFLFGEARQPVPAA
jgi:hypothetical protein